MISSLVLTAVLAAGPNPFLAQALEHEQNLDFERCVERLKQAATQWQSTPDELREIELHAGLCKFNLGQKKAAADHFSTALRIDEATELPPYTSPKAVEFFLEVKRALRAPPPPLPDRDLPDSDLPTDTPLKPKLEPRPPGVSEPLGPVLMKRALPLSLGVVSIASFVTGLALGLRAQSLATEANTARFESDFYRLGDSAQAHAVGSTIAWVISALSAVGTAVTWWVTSEPGPESRP
ncbi:MAG: hypothetical protein Q8L48_11130 [Archangium sp.]|nr:hypothetical protein [Archangium sp.]